MKSEKNMEPDEKFYKDKFEGFFKGFPDIGKREFMNGAREIVYGELSGEDEPDEIEGLWKDRYMPIAQEVWNEHKAKK
ncbi:hypothetical protein R83H12_00568 [Fibrobacteria bacterium R8-3-H12]